MIFFVKFFFSSQNFWKVHIFQKIRNFKGFSLAEVMAAMSIVTLSILTLSYTWSGNYSRMRKIKIYNDMAYLLEMKMKELEVKYENMSFDQIPKKEEGKFEKKYSKYKWIFLIKTFELPDLENIFLDTKGEISEIEKILFRSIKDFLMQNIREVQLTVSIQIKKKELKQSVATYFVKKGMI